MKPTPHEFLIKEWSTACREDELRKLSSHLNLFKRQGDIYSGASHVKFLEDMLSLPVYGKSFTLSFVDIVRKSFTHLENPAPELAKIIKGEDEFDSLNFFYTKDELSEKLCLLLDFEEASILIINNPHYHIDNNTRHIIECFEEIQLYIGEIKPLFIVHLANCICPIYKIQLCDLPAITANNIGYLSYGQDIIQWTESCLNIPNLPIRFADCLIQYQEALLELTCQQSKLIFNISRQQVVDAVLSDAELLKAAYDIQHQLLPQAKTNLVLAFWRDVDKAINSVLKELKHRLETSDSSLLLKALPAYHDKVDEQSLFKLYSPGSKAASSGLCYAIKRLSSGHIITLHVEFFDSLYFGFRVFDAQGHKLTYDQVKLSEAFTAAIKLAFVNYWGQDDKRPDLITACSLDMSFADKQRLFWSDDWDFFKFPALLVEKLQDYQERQKLAFHIAIAFNNILTSIIEISDWVELVAED